MAQYTFLDTEGFTKGLKQFWDNVKAYYSKTSSTNPTVYYTYKSDILATPRTFSIESDDSVVTAPEVDFNGSDNAVLHTTIEDAKSATETELAKHGLMSADDKYKFDKLKKIYSITENIAINEEFPYSRDAKLLFDESTGTLSVLLPYYALKTDLNKVFKFKGVVDTIEELKTIENPEIGDVYHVSENHYDYVWVEGKPDSPKEEDRKNHWESLGPNQNMENYYTKAETDKLLSDERTAREDDDTVLNARVDEEVSDRKSAITEEATARETKYNELQKNINTEGQARISGDNALTESLTKESETRADADNTITQNLVTEAKTRFSADETLTASLNQETADRKSEDSTLQSNIDSLGTELRQADSDIKKSLTTETEERKSEDTKLQNAIDKEITDRQDAINALDVEGTSSENDGLFVFDVSEADGKISVTRKVLEEDLTQLGNIDTKLPPTAKAVKIYVDTTETTYKFTDGTDGKFTVTPYINEKAGTSVEVDTGAINKIESVDVVGTDDNTVTLAIKGRKVTLELEKFIAKIENSSIESLVSNGSYNQVVSENLV